jgi:hypothetical protein
MRKALASSALILIAFSLTGRLAHADNIAYAGAANGVYGAIDLNTGVFTSLGNLGQTPSGMAVANGSLFVASYHTANGTLFTVNPADGSLTTVGTAAGVDYDDFGSTTSGMFVVGTNADLYSINPSTGAATLIGPTGLSFGAWRSLSTNSATLYFANGPDLYTLNTGTGAATLVGSFGDSSEMSVMILEGGVLYGADSIHNTIDTVNAGTGAAIVGPSTTVGATIWGLAPNPIPTSTPEPEARDLLAIGIAALAFLRARSFRGSRASGRGTEASR